MGSLGVRQQQCMKSTRPVMSTTPVCDVDNRELAVFSSSACQLPDSLFLHNIARNPSCASLGPDSVVCSTAASGKRTELVATASFSTGASCHGLQAHFTGEERAPVLCDRVFDDDPCSMNKFVLHVRFFSISWCATRCLKRARLFGS